MAGNVRIIKITRPNQDNPFFYKLDLSKFASIYRDSLDRGEIKAFDMKESDDGLTMTRTFVFRTEQDLINWEARLRAVFTTFDQDRQEYCNACEHILEIS